MKYYLTTERSEVVPFFRAVRAEKRGREATLQGGKAEPPPHEGGRSPPTCPWGEAPCPRGKTPFKICRGLASVRQFSWLDYP